jgi:hypothetical protein
MTMARPEHVAVARGSMPSRAAIMPLAAPRVSARECPQVIEMI